MIVKRLSIGFSDSCANVLPCRVKNVKSQSSFRFFKCANMPSLLPTQQNKQALSQKGKGRCMNIWHIQHYFCAKPKAKNDLEGAEKDCVAALAVCECQSPPQTTSS